MINFISAILKSPKIKSMKKAIPICILCVSVAIVLSPLIVFAQTETFDLTTYTAPKGWTKQNTESALQFSKEDAVKGTYCLITLFKAVPGTKSAKENFDAAWESIVKGMVKTEAAPTMQPGATENGWEAQSGEHCYTH